MARISRSILLALFLAALGSEYTQAQPGTFETVWYPAGRTYITLTVAEDGVYGVDLSSLASYGFPVGSIDLATLQLFENGSEVPISVDAGDGSSGSIAFVGRKNGGADEDWAYHYDSQLRPNTYHSLYSDSTRYFLVWGQEEGLRYADADPTPAGGEEVRAYRHIEHVEDDSYYFFGRPAVSSSPFYTQGEGYMMEIFPHGNRDFLSFQFRYPIQNHIVSALDSLDIAVGFQGGSAGLHFLSMDVRLDTSSSGNLVWVPFDTLTVEDYGYVTLRGRVPQNWIPPSTEQLRVRLNSNNSHGATPNISHHDFTELAYDRRLSIDSGQFSFRSTRSGNRIYDLEGAAGRDLLVLKPASRTRVRISDATQFGDNSAIGEEIWIADSDSLTRPVPAAGTGIDLVNPPRGYDYLIVAGPSLSSSADALADYRSSPEGGGYAVLQVDVREIYNQFDFGRPTPIAIQRFVHASQQWDTAPRFLAMWGDALKPDRTRPRRPWELPSFGSTSADGWFGMFEGGDLDDYREMVAIGRIPIRDNEAGIRFVEKLRNYESKPVERWQKQSILMAGGITESEQAILQAATRRWGTEISDQPYGADITYFFKNEESALDPTFIDSVDAAIQRGTGWLAFFGHSAADTWEIVTASPPLFDNENVLPVAVSLGCFTGAFARGAGTEEDNPVYAELLVTESRNGAIAHYGGSTSSFITPADQIATPLYEVVFNESERILGEAIRESKARYVVPRSGFSQLAIETTLQYNLIGDPATRLTLPSRPDMHLDASSIRVLPEIPIADIDSIMTVEVTLENYGLIPADSILVNVTRVDPAGNRTESPVNVPPFAIEHTFTVDYPIVSDGQGTHRILVTADPLGSLEEEDETDNTAEQTHAVFASGVVLLSPPDRGLTTSVQPLLQLGAASTGDQELQVEIQLDTTSAYDSPALQQQTILLSSIGSWQPEEPLTSGTTYHWRARVSGGTSNEWRQAVFTVQQTYPSDGWFQAGELFRDNEFGRFIEYDDRWRFKQFDVDVSLRSAHFGAEFPNTVIVAGFGYLRVSLGFGVVILDERGQVRDAAALATYANSRRGRDPVAEQDSLEQLLSTLKEGEYLVTMTRFLLADTLGLPEASKQLFRDLGSTKIDSVDTNDLWNFAVRIGDDEPLVDDWVDRDPQTGPHNLVSTLELPINFESSGTVSPPIGPATSWGQLWSEVEFIRERGQMAVHVLSQDGDTLLTRSLRPSGTSDQVELGEANPPIRASEHRFLRLAATFTDTTLQTTPQLTNWYVGYTPVAELTLNSSRFVTGSDTVAEGETFTTAIDIVSAGSAPVDSVFVEWTLTDADNVPDVIKIDTLLELAANSNAESEVAIETLGLPGRNRLTVRVRQSVDREPITFNNTAVGSFFVRADASGPEVVITVNGVEFPNNPKRITSTDDPTLPFLPANSTFEVVVRDENDFLPLNDTTIVNMELDGRKIGYSRPDVTFVPGELGKNEARFVFTPDFAGQDTTHTLTVYAQDASGNENPSKEEPYTFSFRIQTSAEVESIYPYPNPMSSFTTFMFRLRGADPSLVEDFRIRIYTISGRLIREFDLLEDIGVLEDGGLRIGWNRLFWDGTDADGDELGSGVYLYKVFLKAEGRDLEVNNDSNIDRIAIIR